MVHSCAHQVGAYFCKTQDRALASRPAATAKLCTGSLHGADKRPCIGFCQLQPLIPCSSTSLSCSGLWALPFSAACCYICTLPLLAPAA